MVTFYHTLTQLILHIQQSINFQFVEIFEKEKALSWKNREHVDEPFMYPIERERVRVFFRVSISQTYIRESD